MLRYLLCVSFWLFTCLVAHEHEPQPLDIPSNPLDILEGEPSALVNGKVNVITGDFIDFQTDCEFPGIEPIALRRFYCSGSSHESFLDHWKFNHMVSARHPDSDHKEILILEESYGAKIACQSPRKKKEKKDKSLPRFRYGSYDYFVVDDLMHKRITNTGKDMSGKTHLKNRVLHRSIRDNILLTKDGAGNQYHFKKPKSVAASLLERHIKPNGNHIVYNYQQHALPYYISAQQSGGEVLNWMQLKVHQDNKNLISLSVEGKSGIKANYTYEKSKKWLLKKVWRANGLDETYVYDDKRERLTRKSSGKNFLEINYNKKGKVNTLKAPLGNDSTPQTLYTFIYNYPSYRSINVNKNTIGTQVYNALGYLTHYTIGPDERLSEIERYTGSSAYTLYSIEQFFWGPAKTADAGNLKSKVLVLGNGEDVFCRRYGYDCHGNVTDETLYGNLTGCNPAPLKVNDGIPLPNGCEYLYLGREYSKDGFNLLTYENHPKHDQDIKYIYYEGSDRLAGKFICSDAIKVREFYEYDFNGALTAKILDDGSSLDAHDLTNVTQRTITRIKNRDTFPIGLPEIKEEKYLDIQSGKEVLLKKVRYHYDANGYPIKEDYFDCTGAFAYSLMRVFNSKGEVIEETDALGNKIVRRFDNGNKVFEQGPRQDYFTEFTYDYMDRLISKKETHSDGIFTTSYCYDLCGNKISETDSYGNTTYFAYDEFNRLVKVLYPQIQDEKGNAISPEIQKKYDALGNVTTLRDIRGFETHAFYTLHGKPFLIKYPDSTQERFEYSLKGNLVKAIAEDGYYVTYEYDYQSRPIAIKYFNEQGILVRTLTKTYNAFHMISETDASGLETFYSYDGAGRVIKEQKENRLKEYIYDTLGRQAGIRTWHNDNQYVQENKEYDFLNRILKEITLDSLGNERKTSYTYDEAGNCVSKTTGQATTRYVFDSHDRLQQTIDPNGHVTRLVYRNDLRNQLGQFVSYSEEIDPQGFVKVTRKNSLGAVDCTSVKTPYGETIQHTDFVCDEAGNHIRSVETVYGGNSHRKVETAWKYDCRGRLSDLYEAVETSQCRHTQYSYNHQGLLCSVTKPDGVQLISKYDMFKRKTEYQASDHSFCYKYVYNDAINSETITDCLNGSQNVRLHNSNGKLLEEQLGNGLKISYGYDGMGRLIKIIYPDLSYVNYLYEGMHVKSVQRFDQQGDFLYEHTYLTYDECGNPTSSKLIGQAGELNTKYDLLNRPIEISSRDWNEKSITYDSVGNLTGRSLNDSFNSTSYRYSYDGLHQLNEEQGMGRDEFLNDSLYNQISKNGKIQNFNSLNQLENDELVYDVNGNLIRKGKIDTGINLSYDALGRLIKVSTKEKEIIYHYDSFNRRITKVSNDSEEHFFYAFQNEIGKWKNSIVEARVLALGKGQEIGSAIGIELNGCTYTPVHDHLGHICALINSNDGSIREIYRHSAYKEVQVVDSSGEAIQQSINPWRFASKRNDEESGLIYFGERYYDPSIGRWLTPDPAGFIDTMNLYAYVRNNPLKYIDPTGQVAFAIPFIVAAWGATEVTTISYFTFTSLATAAVCWATYTGVKYIDTQVLNSSSKNDFEDIEDDYLNSNNRKSKHKKNGPSNQFQNAAANAAKLEIARRIGRELTKKENEKFHRLVSKMGYNYQEMVEEGINLLK